MVLAQTEQNHQMRKVDPRPAFHYLSEDDEEEQVSERTESSGPTKRWRRSVYVEESRR